MGEEADISAYLDLRLAIGLIPRVHHDDLVLEGFRDQVLERREVTARVGRP